MDSAALSQIERDTAAESAEVILRMLLITLKITGAHHG